jgi:hypothetical protein
MTRSVDSYNKILLQISCTLSIFGSLTVMFICHSKGMLEKQKGKYLIFWLSFCDFSSSLIYLISSFSLTEEENNSKRCQIYALLGIFFPVASFLWTDFIAYYLYSMIVSRKSKTELEWKQLLIYFHLISWGVSALCILIIASFQHAGRSNESNEGDNTGGWCWVAASSKSLILWEIIGGKFIEWISAFLILPYFYFITARTLMSLDRSWSNMIIDKKRVPTKTRSDLWESVTNTTASVRYSIQTYLYPDLLTETGAAQVPYAPLLKRTRDQEEGYHNSEEDHEAEGGGGVEDDMSSSTHQSHSPQSFQPSLETHRTVHDTKQLRYEETHNTPKFRRFYAKMVSPSLLISLSLDLTSPALAIGSCSNFILYCPDLGFNENHNLHSK